MTKTTKLLAPCALALVTASACADLDVVNPNDADTERALATAEDVESLISGAYNSWYSGNHESSGAGPFLSNAAFQHNAPWANFGMEEYARIPRVPIVNQTAHGLYGNFTRNWTFSYRALLAAADGLLALEKPEIAEGLGEEATLRATAFARFVQGLAHAQLAVLYDQAWVVDETTERLPSGEPVPAEPVGHAELMNIAMGYMDQAIELAGQGSFDIPLTWMRRDIDSQEFIAFIHSMKARYRALNARTPEERAAVDWAQVSADVDAGITEDFVINASDEDGWFSAVFYYPRPGWAEISYFMWGMADQSGNYQNWLALPMAEKDPNVNGEPTLIITPDLRFPQGSTLEEQRADANEDEHTDGRYFIAPTDINSVWAQPGRGTWRWSYYRLVRHIDYVDSSAESDLPEITVRELKLLKAEALFRMGDRAGVAAIINETRVPNGLNGTDAAGTNTSCVPKLPNGQCGDLFEMLKWEKRLETHMYGPVTVGMYFDSRGWGDLWQGTPLQFPVPCGDLEILEITPCETTGGVGGEMASPGSSYSFPHEG